MKTLDNDGLIIFEPGEIHREIISILTKHHLCFEEAVKVLQETQIALGKIKLPPSGFASPDS